MKYTITIEKATTKGGNVFDSLLVYIGENEEETLKVFDRLCAAFITGNTLKGVTTKQDDNFRHIYIEVTL